MPQKVFISGDNTATFVCPQCGSVTTADVAKYVTIDKRVTVNCKCRCRHRFSAILEKRKQYRKETNLPGTYYCRREGRDVDKGIMRVIDISSKGLKFKLNVARSFRLGQTLRVEFHLDDKRHTLINKKVIVRNVHKNLVGASFAPTEGDDPHLGFYLMS